MATLVRGWLSFGGGHLASSCFQTAVLHQGNGAPRMPACSKCGERWWACERLCRRCEYEPSSRGPRRACARPGCDKITTALSSICDRCQQYLLQAVFSHYDHGIDLFSNAFDELAGIAPENLRGRDLITPQADPQPFCPVCAGGGSSSRAHPHPTDTLNKVLTECGVIVRTQRFSESAMKVLIGFFSAVMEVLRLVAGQRR